MDLEKEIYIESNINEFYGITKVYQTYINHSENEIELKIILPLKKEIQFSKFTLLMDGKKIISKVLSKEKAKEKYTDSIAKGNTATMTSYDEDNTTYCINIGRIKPNTKLELMSEFIQFITSDDISFCFSIMRNYPYFSSLNPNQCSIKINLETQSKITRLIIKSLKYPYKKTFNDNLRKCIIELKMENLKDRYKEPINILFRTEKINEPFLIKQYNPINDETSYIMEMVYNSIIIPIPNEPDTNENINYFMKYENIKENDIPSLFIFLIDQSGSMSGNPIKLVSESLLFFLQSLPKKSYFQLIGFGSDFKKINEIPLEYNKDNVNETNTIIKNLKADLGGTNISSPLKYIFNCKDYNNFPLSKNLFILTDGEVNNTQECLELISNNCEEFKIHTIGLGKYFDKELIKKAGIQGKGSYNFVEDISQINSTIIKALNNCLKKYLIHPSFNVLNEKIEYEFNSNRNFCYQNEIINYSFIKKGKFDNETIEINFKADEVDNKIDKNFIFTKDNILSNTDGDIISKIIIGNILKNNNIDEEKEINLSKKYQILSQNTSLFAEIENESQIIGELKKYNIEQYLSEDDSSSDHVKRWKAKKKKKSCKKDYKKCKSKKKYSKMDSDKEDSSSEDDKKYKSKKKYSKMDSDEEDSSSEDDKKYKYKKKSHETDSDEEESKYIKKKKKNIKKKKKKKK